MENPKNLVQHDFNRNLTTLLTLPLLQRQIALYLTRHGPTAPDKLIQVIADDPVELHHALTTLLEKGWINLSATGEAVLNLGHTRRHNLPARLWPALFASTRLYSTQEIATLRTVVPILQFARAKLGEFTDHGPGHALRVKSFATQLGYILGLTTAEQHLLRAAALFHDVGNIIEREHHHILSQETVEKLTSAGQLPFSTREGTLIGLLCRWHRKEYEPDRQDELQNETIRTGLLASILRVADAMDIDYRRADYNEQFISVIRLFFSHEMPYWTSIQEVLGVRLRCLPELNFQVFTQGKINDNMQIAMLRKDLAVTPIAGSVQQITAKDDSQIYRPTTGANGQDIGVALLVFPFDPHSLIMAALSRQKLHTAGYTVELLCYPDTSDGPAWLWGEALTTLKPTRFVRLVVIGDRPDPNVTSTLLNTIKQWRSSGVRVTILNRHELNWSRVPDLLGQGVEVTLGGDWAYFWGDTVSETDLAWGRIAALCTRDPTQATIGLQAREGEITQGLLKTVYDAVRQPPDNIEGWSAVATPIMNRIIADDPTYFALQASDFIAHYATLTTPGQVKGKVLCFDLKPGEATQTCFWALEQAIERQGRTPDRGFCFQIPYALATWLEGDTVELLAINHWRDEAAIPIRLLYPTELGPPPDGNESTIRVRLPVGQADRVVQALVEACNQT
ncbi:MAG: HD domain-containing protein [Anaerolineae bacterium]